MYVSGMNAVLLYRRSRRLVHIQFTPPHRIQHFYRHLNVGGGQNLAQYAVGVKI